MEMVLSVLTMIFGRKKTIFHVEETLPDPEEVKFRFRRRIMAFSFFGAIGILAVPVLKEMEATFHLKREIREVSEYLLESKKIAIQNRKPVLLELSAEGKSWKRSLSSKEGSCSISKGSEHHELATELVWTLNLKNSTGETVQRRELCFDPVKGILAGDAILGDSLLLLSASSAGQGGKSAYILISRFGDEIQYADTL